MSAGSHINQSQLDLIRGKDTKNFDTERDCANSFPDCITLHGVAIGSLRHGTRGYKGVVIIYTLILILCTVNSYRDDVI